MNCLYFAKDGTKRVGAVVINPYINAIQYLCVLPEYRRNGIGKKLLETAIQELRKKRCDHFSVEINSDLNDGYAFAKATGLTIIKQQTVFGMKIPDPLPQLENDDDE